MNRTKRIALIARISKLYTDRGKPFFPSGGWDRFSNSQVRQVARQLGVKK